MSVTIFLGLRLSVSGTTTDVACSRVSAASLGRDNNACSSRKQGERFVRWDTTTCAAAGRGQQVTHIHFWSFDQVPLCAHDYWGVWKNNNNCRAYTVILLTRNDSDRSFSFDQVTGTSNYIQTIISSSHILLEAQLLRHTDVSWPPNEEHSNQSP